MEQGRGHAVRNQHAGNPLKANPKGRICVRELKWGDWVRLPYSLGAADALPEVPDVPLQGGFTVESFFTDAEAEKLGQYDGTNGAGAASKASKEKSAPEKPKETTIWVTLHVDAYP